jgi:hypothetical protein
MLQFGRADGRTVAWRMVQRQAGVRVDQRNEWVVEKKRNKKDAEEGLRTARRGIRPNLVRTKTQERHQIRLVGVGFWVNMEPRWGDEPKLVRKQMRLAAQQLAALSENALILERLSLNWNRMAVGLPHCDRPRNLPTGAVLPSRRRPFRGRRRSPLWRSRAR